MSAARRAGFTLVEALVALAIVAVALAAAGRAASVSSLSSGEARLRILAGFVAENKMTELSVRGQWPALGAAEGTASQAGVEFAWRVEVLSTPNPDLRRVEIRVLSPGEASHELRRLIGVLARGN